MFIIKHKWIFLSFSTILLVGSLVLLFTTGIRKGIDFTGGTDVVIAYNGYSANSDGKINLDFIKNNLIEKGFKVKSINLQNINASGTAYVDIKLTGDIRESNRVEFEDAWSFNHDTHYEAKQISENIIGPSMGKELTKKAFTSVILVSLIMLIFIAYSFREVSKPVSSWKFGLFTVVALAHDIIITLGVYVILGITDGAEIDSLFILALLTIMAISMADTIVVYDRIRENLKRRKGGETFEETVGISIDQTLLRSFNTSLAVLLVLFALFFFGPASIHDFTLTLIVGMTIGTYSSIFIASPLLVITEKIRNKLKKRKA